VAADAPVPAVAAAEAAVHYGLGLLAYGRSDWETARRRFLLSLRLDPLQRMTHIYLARIYARLEEAALKDAPADQDAGAVLMAKVGLGSSDQHIDMAQQILDRTAGEDLQALVVYFRFNAGAVADFQARWTTASGIARIQRPAAEAEAGVCRVELCGDFRAVLDEKTFPPVQVLYWDGRDAQGKMIGGKDEQRAFPVSLELLALRPGRQVIVYAPAGRKIFAAAVAGR